MMHVYNISRGIHSMHNIICTYILVALNLVDIANFVRYILYY